MRKLFVILAVFMLSCKHEQKPPNAIPLDKMKVVLWQLMQADEYYARASVIDTTLKLEKKNVQLYKQIFALNKVDRAAFYATLTYLQKRPIEFKELMDSTYALSKREKMRLNIH